MYKLFFFISIFLNFSVWAQGEKIDDFVVSVYDRSIKVISPDAVRSKYIIVVENRSLGRIIGKLQGSSGKTFAIMSIEPNQFNKTSLELKKNERYFFVPMAPAFQEAELIVGHKTYEIPPKH